MNLPRSDSGPLVVVGQPAGFSSNPLENVVHEPVHVRHGLGADACIRVHVLQNLVDVDPSLPLAAFGGLPRPLTDLPAGTGTEAAAFLGAMMN